MFSESLKGVVTQKFPGGFAPRPPQMHRSLKYLDPPLGQHEHRNKENDDMEVKKRQARRSEFHVGGGGGLKRGVSEARKDGGPGACPREKFS